MGHQVFMTKPFKKAVVLFQAELLLQDEFCPRGKGPFENPSLPAVNLNTSTMSKPCCRVYFFSAALKSVTVLATSEFKSVLCSL